ncbi:uncharacterized protein LOC125070102 [Vanessa atalanta]|uniref:uncharacterized protein LOC125070102 n=1 Tax=Vanessa atalanta TaxID=42275 RepID=UPI001FCD074F|nr:uncharacterized protein LOC125070102 [Vanessa atalanta]
MFRRKKCFNTLFYIVKYFIISNIFIKSTKSSQVIKGSLPDLHTLFRLFNTFIEPVIRSYPADKPVIRTIETEIEKVIREKTAQLRYLLQDNDVKNLENKLFLEDKDETTIIEFLPKTDERNKDRDDVFKTHLKKYKKIREKINRALIKESVSDKTQKLVVRTLDDLIRNLVGSQCKWKRNLRADGYEEPAVIADRWNQGLRKLRRLLINLFKNDFRRNDDVPVFLDNLQMLFNTVTKDVDTVSKRYKIQCEFVPKSRSYSLKHGANGSNSLRNSWDKTDDEDRCQNVVVCSNELKEFMQKLYLALNDTSISVIRNYAEMYSRDVTGDNENDKDTVIVTLNTLSGKTIGNIKDIFVKETKMFTLDKGKNKEANIDALTNYVKNTVEHVKENIKSNLNSDIVTLGEKIKTVIRDDINVNLVVDLGNLEREFVSKICSIFRFCNGKYSGRRFLSQNKNSLYVQVQLTMDDVMADNNHFRSIINKKNIQNTTIHQNAFANVTRTTYI